MFNDKDSFNKYCIEKDISIKCNNCDYPTYPYMIMESIKHKILPSYFCYNCESLIISTQSRQSADRYYNSLEVAAKLYNCEYEWKCIKQLEKLKFRW